MQNPLLRHGDYLTRDGKLSRISELGSVAEISRQGLWTQITGDRHGDWLKQRDEVGHLIPMGDKKTDGAVLFDNFSLGIATGRDAWCYNFDYEAISTNVARMIDFYNAEESRYRDKIKGLTKDQRPAPEEVIDNDPTKISWTDNLRQDVTRGKKHVFQRQNIVQSLYRPFTKQWLYYARGLNQRVYQMPKLFPTGTDSNRVIVVKQRWNGYGQFALMTDCISALQPDGGAQCFPLYLYDLPEAPETESLFSDVGSHRATRRDAITDAGFAQLIAAYPGEAIQKEDVFYYIYGMLHSAQFQLMYADNLSKEIPRVPSVRTAEAFWQISQAGRSLGDLHVNFESAELYRLKIESREGADLRTCLKTSCIF